MKQNSKTKRLDIRLSQEDWDILNKKAENNGLPIATYAREKLFFDLPHLEKNSFEHKVLKGISYMVGAVRVMTKDQKPEVIEEVKKILEKNGIEVEDK